MDLNINSNVLVECRKERAWSQQQLADVSGLSLRTIQRIEKSGIASSESVKAICSAFDVTPNFLVKPKEKNTRKRVWSLFGAIVFFIFTLFGIFQYSQATAEQLTLSIQYKMESEDLQEISEGQFEYLLDIGKEAALELPNNMELLFIPENTHDNTMSVQLVDTLITEDLRYSPPIALTGDNGTSIFRSQEGKGSINIEIQAIEK